MEIYGFMCFFFQIFFQRFLKKLQGFEQIFFRIFQKHLQVFFQKVSHGFLLKISLGIISKNLPGVPFTDFFRIFHYSNNFFMNSCNFFKNSTRDLIKDFCRGFIENFRMNEFRREEFFRDSFSFLFPGIFTGFCPQEFLMRFLHYYFDCF